MEDFIRVKLAVQKRENYVERNSKTVGGRWTVDSWELNGVVFSVMDEGYTERIFVKGKLEVIKRYDNKLLFKMGSYEDLEVLADSFS